MSNCSKLRIAGQTAPENQSLEKKKRTGTNTTENLSWNIERRKVKFNMMTDYERIFAQGYEQGQKDLIRDIKKRINGIKDKSDAQQMSDCLLLMLQITPSEQKNEEEK